MDREPSKATRRCSGRTRGFAGSRSKARGRSRSRDRSGNGSGTVGVGGSGDRERERKKGWYGKTENGRREVGNLMHGGQAMRDRDDSSLVQFSCLRPTKIIVIKEHIR